MTAEGFGQGVRHERAGLGGAAFGAAALADGDRPALVVAARRRSDPRRLPRRHRARRYAGLRPAPGTLDRAHGVLLVRGRAPRLGRPLAGGGAACARLPSQPFHRRRRHRGGRGRSRGAALRPPLRPLRAGLRTPCIRQCARGLRCRHRLARGSGRVAHDARSPLPPPARRLPRGRRRRAAAAAGESAHAPARGRTRLDICRSKSRLARHGGRHRHALPDALHRSGDRRAAGIFRRRLVAGAGAPGSYLRARPSLRVGAPARALGRPHRPDATGGSRAIDRLRRPARLRCPPRRGGQRRPRRRHAARSGGTAVGAGRADQGLCDHRPRRCRGDAGDRRPAALPRHADARPVARPARCERRVRRRAGARHQPLPHHRGRHRAGGRNTRAGDARIAARGLSGDRGLVLHLAPFADGARGA